jgi:hypothetical protein
MIMSEVLVLVLVVPTQEIKHHDVRLSLDFLIDL